MLPFQCALCHSKSALTAVCAPCAADIDDLRLLRCCRWCAAPDAVPVCADCLKRPPYFDGVAAAFVYRQPLAFLIQSLKYGGGWQLAKFLSRRMPPPPPADIALAVPLHPARERSRGFNQSRELLRHMRLRADDDALRRIINTPPQADLDAEARRKNVRGAFRADGKRVRGLSVLLVDDVMTSGATLNEAARALKEAGAESVYVSVLARASRYK